MIIDTQLDIVIAISLVLMWLMGYWLHWYSSLIKKHKLNLKLLELAEEHQNKVLNGNIEDLSKNYQESGKALAYLHSVEVIKKYI